MSGAQAAIAYFDRRDRRNMKEQEPAWADKSDLERWRRDTELPIVARILTLSATTHWRTGQAGFEALPFEAAQLDLIAGRPLRDAAGALVGSHESLAHWLRPASRASDVMELWTTESDKLVGQLRDQLIATARTDLGIG